MRSVVHACSLVLAISMSAAALVGCAGALPDPQALREMNAARGMPQVKAGAELAPQAYAEAERYRGLSIAAAEQGDALGSDLLAERAKAAYTRTGILARLALARKEADDAAPEENAAREALRELTAARAGADREADELERQLKVARESMLPATSGPTTADREAARLVAARSLALQGRLLCSAARLLDPSMAGLDAAVAEVGRLEGVGVAKAGDSAAKARPPVVDDAARARAACLELLTKARRSAKSDGAKADALLGELSAVGKWSPARDERGVVVVLRGIWKGDGLTPEGRSSLEELGRVAAAHDAFPVQVVTHDAKQEGAVAAGPARAETAAKVLADAGGTKVKTQAESAGTGAPLVDPADARARERNARLEIVFVAPGT